MRITMTVSEGNVEWRGTTNKGEIIEMPLAIQLDSFVIEEYEPKLVVIDSQTGRILPESKPETYMYEGVGSKTQLAGISIEVMTICLMQLFSETAHIQMLFLC